MNLRCRIIFILIALSFIFSLEGIAAKEWNTPHPFPGSVFIENKGLMPESIDQIGKIQFGLLTGDPVLFGEKGICFYQLNRKARHFEVDEKEIEGKMSQMRPADEHYRMVFLKWEGANQQVTILREQKRDDYFTCVLQEDEKFTGVQMNGYHRIIYENLYNGIDLILETKEEKAGFEYSFRIHPGADVNQIRLSLSGDLKGKIKLTDSEIKAFTKFGTLTQSDLSASYQDGEKLNCRFILAENEIGFALTENYDKSREVIIDPWVVSGLSSLTNNGVGYDVDYDYNGNLFVYGGGDDVAAAIDFKVAKYSSAGTLLWTFLGLVPSATWTSLGSGVDNYPGNFIVEKSNGKSYVAQGFETNGTRMVRINANGLYDNFVSTADVNYRETWDMAFDCNTGEVFACGGGTNSNINFGIVNTAIGSVTTTNITGLPGSSQDIVNVTNDYSGNIYALFAGPDLQIGNYIYMVNAARTGNVWFQPTGYTTVTEAMNKPYITLLSNGANLMAVNDHYLYYYDGARLKAINKTTGVGVGNVFNITSGVELMQTGITVDNCDNVYIGGTGFIVPFHFDGTNFSGRLPISLGAGLGNSAVHDIRYNFSDNTLYVTGSNFAGIYNATESISCNSIDVVANGSCSGTGNAVLTTNLTGYTFEYLWFHSSGVIIRNHTTTNLTDSISGLAPGTYTIRVQVIGSCGGPATVDTLTIGSGGFTFSINSNNPDCSNPTNGSATAVNISGSSGPYTYSWNTTPVQTTPTAVGLPSGTYVCTITDATGCTSSSTVTLVAPTGITISSNHTDVLCSGGSNGIATAIPPATGGPFTYQWQPGGGNAATISNLSAGTYTCQVTNADGCTASVSVTITEPPALTATSTHTDATCFGSNNGTATAVPPPTGAPFTYQWQPGGGSAATISNLAPGTYTCTVTTAQGCTAVTSTVVTEPPALIASAAANPTVVCPGEQIILYASGGTSYVWADGPTGANRTVTVNGPLTYNVIATDATGCTGSATVSVNVHPVPVADFSGVSSCLGDPVSFLNTSSIASGGTLNYEWNFGDGDTSSLRSPQHLFNTTGTQNVQLIVSSANNCKDTLMNTVNVWPLPVSDLFADPRQGCPPLELEFENRSLSADSIISYRWTFSDGQSSTSDQPDILFRNPGIYDAALEVMTINGCKDDTTFTSYIEVFDQPKADFNYNPVNATEMFPMISFLDFSSDATSWYWDFGDSATSIEREPAHTYPSSGQYIAMQVVTDVNGCTDSITKIIDIGREYAIYIPNTFTPNGDGVNEEFKVLGFNISDFNISIFNRWGVEIFTSADMAKPWDGSYKGSNSQEGVYNYLVTFRDVHNQDHRLKGRVNLVR